MVTRKNSLPYPHSPTAPSTQAATTAPATGALFGSAPQHSQPSQSSFMESDNPWQDQGSHIGPGQNAHHHQREHSLTNIPQALRPGGSGQDTPRSSIDSGESRDWWDDDDAGDKSPSRSPVRAAARSPDRTPARDIPESLRPRGPSPAAAPQAPSPTSIKRKPLPTAQPPPQEGSPPHADFASNNPFRNASTPDAPPPPSAAPPPIPGTASWSTPKQEPEGKGKTPIREPLFSASITDFSRMTIAGSTPDPSAYHQVQTPQEQDDPWKSLETSPAPPTPSVPAPTVPKSQLQSQEEPWKQFDDAPPHPAPSVPRDLRSQPHQTLSIQPPLIPVSKPNHQQEQQNPWTTEQHNYSPTSSMQHGPPPFPVIAQGGQESGIVAVPTGRSESAYSQASNPPRAEPSLIDDDDIGPSLPVRPNQTGGSQQDEIYAPPPGPPPGRGMLGGGGGGGEAVAPPKPPRPAIVTKPLSDAERAKMAEQRNETYQIKHFNWFDHSSGRLRRSSMLTQNKNGPCPLLALVNALILGKRDESQAALDDALRSREQVSLGLIIETLMDELIQRSGDQVLDVEEINAFLMRLRTGMNANPRFVPAAAAPPTLMDARNSILHMPQQQRSQITAGGFESTGDIKMYECFRVPLLHGWIPEPGSDAEKAFVHSAQTYEDASTILFNLEELDYKLTRDGLNQEEQRVWEDLHSIKGFLDLHSTQLTPTGLENIQRSLPSGSFAILFRNDHFSTIFKHPQSGQLFTLITDAGYADRDEIIWESLVDISGRASEFFSGDFMPVSHQQASAAASTNNNTQQHLTIDDHSDNAPLSPQQQQEQHDADFAMALQLQEEEEQRQRAEQARRRRSGPNSSSQGGGGSNNNSFTQPGRSPRGSSTGNIPITLTASRQSNSDAPENRPSMPPRRQQGPPAVNRPADANDEDAPPAYEEAAKGRPYIPPVGSPLHPTSGPAGGPDSSISPMSSSAQLTGTVSNNNTANGNGGLSAHPPGPNAPYYGGSGGAAGQQQQQRPGNGRIPSNSIGGGRLSAYQDQASIPTQSNMSPGGWNSRLSYGPMPGSYQHVGATGGESGGKRRRGDCVVM